jgi:hypothetical protein
MTVHALLSILSYQPGFIRTADDLLIAGTGLWLLFQEPSTRRFLIISKQLLIACNKFQIC